MTVEEASGDVRGAARFFWTWLFLATAVSVAGNVAHAVLTAPPGTVRLAGAAAVVPPAVLLGATHSVALLVKTRRIGFIYWCALAMTVALAGCAFVLSFDALRDLAVALGMPASRAWLWPVAIDVSIANSTLSLLSLAPPRTAASRDSADGATSTVSSTCKVTTALEAAQSIAASDDPAPPVVSPSRPRQPGTTASEPTATPPPRNASPDARPAGRRALAAVDRPARIDIKQWQAAADDLIRDGVTSKDPAVVAAVLAEQAAGTAPSTIGRRHGVHHSTVARILEEYNRRAEGSAVGECLTG